MLTKNRTKEIMILLSLLIIFLLLFVFRIEWLCPFKRIFHIACPGCGMTRAINYLLNFKIMESFKMNILAIPAVVLLFISIILIIKDIIKDENKYIMLVFKIINKYSILILIILLVTMIINNANNI